MHVLCKKDCDRTFPVSPFVSCACIVSSLEKNIPDSDMPSSVAFNVAALVFGTTQAMIAANSMHEINLHEARPV
jgi:hypothetical protein